MTLEDQCYEIIDSMDANTIALIKRDPELFDTWKDLGTEFFIACHRAIELGANAADQNRLIELQTIIQNI